MTSFFSGHTAIFGGSFNPPHRGHLEAISGLMKHPGVSRVQVVPSYGTPLKNTGISFEHRSNMARIAFSGFAEVDLIEAIEKVQYTWQLLQVLKARIPKAAFVIGTDQFRSLTQWARFPEVLGMCDWIVLRRKPETPDHSRTALQAFVSERVLNPSQNENEFEIPGTSHRLCFFDTEAPAISSTQIRESFALGNKESAINLLPPGVIEYIERNHLYGT